MGIMLFCLALRKPGIPSLWSEGAPLHKKELNDTFFVCVDTHRHYSSEKRLLGTLVKGDGNVQMQLFLSEFNNGSYSCKVIFHSRNVCLKISSQQHHLHIWVFLSHRECFKLWTKHRKGMLTSPIPSASTKHKHSLKASFSLSQA